MFWTGIYQIIHSELSVMSSAIFSNLQFEQLTSVQIQHILDISRYMYKSYVCRRVLLALTERPVDTISYFFGGLYTV